MSDQATRTPKSSNVEKPSPEGTPADLAGDQDIDTAGTEADDNRTMEQRSTDAADEAGSAFLPVDKVLLQDEGLRRPAPKESVEGDAEPETGKHTEATMPPGEGKDPKRNTM